MKFCHFCDCPLLRLSSRQTGFADQSGSACGADNVFLPAVQFGHSKFFQIVKDDTSFSTVKDENFRCFRLISFIWLVVMKFRQNYPQLEFMFFKCCDITPGVDTCLKVEPEASFFTVLVEQYLRPFIFFKIKI